MDSAGHGKGSVGQSKCIEGHCKYIVKSCSVLNCRIAKGHIVEIVWETVKTV